MQETLPEPGCESFTPSNSPDPVRIRVAPSGLVLAIGATAPVHRPRRAGEPHRDPTWPAADCPGLGRCRRNHPIGEITPSRQEPETGTDSRAVHRNAAGLDQRFDGAGAVAGGKAIHAPQHPDQFAKHRQGDGNQLVLLQQSTRRSRLLRVILNQGTHQQLGVRGDPQGLGGSRPAQPQAAASRNSSRLARRGLRPARRPMKPSIAPVACSHGAPGAHPAEPPHPAADQADTEMGQQFLAQRHLALAGHRERDH